MQKSSIENQGNLAKPNVGSSALKISRLIKNKKILYSKISQIDKRIESEINNFLEWFVDNNNLWCNYPTKSSPYFELTISNVDLEKGFQLPDEVNKCYKIIKTKEGHIWGLLKTVYGNYGWNSHSDNTFFNFEKGKYLTELQYDLFLDFINLYKSKNKIILGL